MSYSDDLLKTIDTAVTDFIDKVPAIQKKIYAKVIELNKELDLDAAGDIKNNLNNIKIIGQLKSELEDIILNKPYLNSVGDLLGTYSVIEEVQNNYFSTLVSEFSPKKVYAEVTKQAVDDTANMLTEAGIDANVISPLKEIMKTNITSGGSYADLQEQLRNEIIGNDEIDGKLLSYTGQLVTDSVNQYSAQYTQIVTDDLGLDWFAYQGSLIKTSRPFCIALHDKEYFHRSEIPKLLNGKVGGVSVPKCSNDLPCGMIDGTTPETFMVYRGGYNCGHQIIPISRDLVPQELLKKFEDEE